MVVTITIVFIVSSIPCSVHMIVMMAVPEFNSTDRHYMLYTLLGMFIVGVSSINSGINMIIYYKMSHKFRHAMLGLF